MSTLDVEQRLATAESLGYRFAVRHQPQADLAEPDWIVVVTTPDGRTLYPGAVDNEESKARRRAAALVERDMAGRQDVDA